MGRIEEGRRRGRCGIGRRPAREERGKGRRRKVGGDPDMRAPLAAGERGEKRGRVLGRVGRKWRGDSGHAGRKRRWTGEVGRGLSWLDRFGFFSVLFFFQTLFKFKSFTQIFTSILKLLKPHHSQNSCIQIMMHKHLLLLNY
jgi:hypothetical protein